MDSRSQSGRAASHVFIGRDRERGALRAALTDAANGCGGLFLLMGEPGIGKTRLAEETAGDAVGLGATVAWGRCWEGGGAPAYWPWVQVLRSLLRNRDRTSRRALLSGSAQHVRHLIPEIGDDDGASMPPPSTATPDHARVALFDALVNVLERASNDRPLVLILDDLHAADLASLLFLQFAARELRAARTLMLGTCRDADVQRQPASAQVFMALARENHRLGLSGLSQDDTAAFLREGFNWSPPAPVVAAVHRRTEGNPFFIDEIARQLATVCPEGLSPAHAVERLHIPHGIREAIRERLRPLSNAAHELLAVAAIIGREFDLPLLQNASQRPAAESLNLIDEAAASGIVKWITGAPARYGFAHSLIRDTLYDDQSPAHRAALHQRIGIALAAAHGDDPSRWAEIAHHLFHATGRETHQAIDYLLRAARRALSVCAYEEAAGLFEHALASLESTTPDNPGQRIDALLGLGNAQLRSGQAYQSRETFRRAADLADRTGTSLQFAHAALGFADRGLGPPPGAAEVAVVDLLEAALKRSEDDPAGAGLRPRLLARLAAELAMSEPERATTLSAEAVALARPLQQPVTLAHTLSSRHFVLWRSDYLADRLSVAGEITEIGAQLNDPDLAIQGRTWRLIDRMNAGDFLAFDRDLAAYEPLAAALRRPRYQWMTVNLQAVRALWRGQWIDAIMLAERALVLAERTDDATARINPMVQMYAAQRERGELSQQLPLAQLAVERYRNSPVPRTLLAMTYSELGQVDAARAEFEQLAHDEFGDLRRERRLGVLPYLTEVCSVIRDHARANALYDLLLPYAGGTLAYGMSVPFGAASHYLGVLAATMGRFDDAFRHFDTALQHNARARGDAWLARTQYEYARTLHRTRDVARAAELAAAAGATARRLGMTRLAEQLRGLPEVGREPAAIRSRHLEPQRIAAAGGTSSERTQLVPLPSPTKPLRSVPQPAAGEPAAFQRDCGYWTIGLAGSAIRLRDTKGLRCIAALLRHPERAIHVCDLETADDRRGPADHAALQPLEQRLADLRDQFAEAMQFNDLARAAALRQHIETLTDDLTTSRSTAEVERARINVTRAIKTAIRRIAKADPHLGHHLNTCIRTGTLCRYVPDPRVDMRWRV
ncbi:MAG TPA: AAA family ATPase [Candidatus Binatia bacterium]|nr:AAA family ATPase [Candidatus Binatia bacterium]